MMANLILKVKQFLGFEPKFLCDKCAYDYDGACHHAARPNATSCKDYKARGT